MMHGMDWDGQDVTDWLASEKLDGCRAYWTGAQLLTKSGREYRNTPAPLLAALRSVGTALDCELYAGRGMLQTAVNAARLGRWAEGLALHVFDLPSHLGTAEERCEALQRLALPAPLHRVTRMRVAGIDDAHFWMRRIQEGGGEGVMLLDPGARYRPGRTDRLLKVKAHL